MGDWLQFGALGILAAAMWWVATYVIKPFMDRHMASMDAQTAAMQSIDRNQERGASAQEKVAVMMDRFQPLEKDPKSYETVDTNAALLEVSQQIHRIAKGMNIDDEDLVDRIRDILVDARRK